ncbi:MAG: NTP transferase domain-containing protein [Lachnospiraceae bacterium]|nr:NTP transferase domain-containing protein [Lachnospiraceae bacterium]
MSLCEADILNILKREPYTNQRSLSEVSGYSIGATNKAINGLVANGYLNDEFFVTERGRALFDKGKPKNAIILAAGYGMRMVPINLSTPKALLEVNGELLIERQIKQLHSVGIYDITVVVGFMKESFEYLIDEYGVKLVVNPDYVRKNNLSSLALVTNKISNTYIIPSDIWCRNNPFNDTELYSWYMMSDSYSSESDVRVNRKREITRIGNKAEGNTMIGISYIMECDAVLLREKLLSASKRDENDDEFWETSLYDGNKMFIPARLVSEDDVYEINTYEQLRSLDGSSNHLRSDAINVISDVFHIKADEISDISVLKKGMTNRSFLFSAKGEKYIMRIPGEGTDKLINRAQEAEVFRAISGLGLCDDPVYINPDNGYKITKYLEGIRVCDPENRSDLEKCMRKLKEFHDMKLSVPHVFDIFGQIEFYESLWNGQSSMYKDYYNTKKNVLSFKPFIEGIEKEWCLTHIDAVPDNFLFYATPEGEALQLTDWEYSGMQDPHVDIAMFSIYSLYDKKQVDELIDIYFNNACDPIVRTKIYAYIAMCGLLWSNWCEYKAKLGVEFGEYSLRQYRYAKEYYRYAVEGMKEN